jgi:8-oxo-dGTP pyrophosphatase MutT (NUDIX family)
MIFADVVQQLETGLRGELPGPDAQARLAPSPRRQWPAGFNHARIRHAAGLLLVFPKTIDAEPTSFDQPVLSETLTLRPAQRDRRVDRLRMSAHGEPVEPVRASRALRSSSEDAHVVLTVRADSLGRHRGQVSLPGGGVEPGETFEQAALREAHEEIGLRLQQIRVLGALTSLDIPVSGFRLHPVLAVTTSHPKLSPSDAEVAHILEVGLEDLLDPANFVSTERERDGFALTVPAFHVGGHEIWGATAMVLAEFLALLGWTGHEGR